MKLILSAALAALFLVFSNAQAQTMTGCLSNGKLTSVAVGGSPAKSPCKGIEVTFGGGGGEPGDKGPDGEKGPDGDKGLDGDKGPDGDSGSGGGGAQESLMLTNHKPGDEYIDGIIAPWVWHQCATVLGGRPAHTGDLGTLPVDPSVLGHLFGWIQPTIVAFDNSNNELVDISGVTAKREALVCADGTGFQWNENTFPSTGLVTYSSTGVLADCRGAFPLVCAVPIP